MSESSMTLSVPRIDVSDLLAALLPASVHAQAKPAADADIVARVNNDVITLSYASLLLDTTNLP
jgi:hypothetical protein